MAEIKLTQGKVAIVDDEDFEWLNQWGWNLGRDGYARRTERLGRVNGKYKYRGVYMHRVINKTPEGLCTDHINGGRLDNRRSNLRVATKLQNNVNRSKQSNNTSGYKGVWKKRNRWVAQIRLSGKTIYLGTRETPEDAHELYKLASVKYFGEFSHV